MGYPPFAPHCPRKRDNPEGRLVLSILKELRWRGHYAAKMKVKGGIKQGRVMFRDPYQAVGLPDIIAFTPGLSFIEAKAPKGVQTPHQKDFQAHCDKAGIPYILARSVNDVLWALNFPS